MKDPFAKIDTFFEIKRKYGILSAVREALSYTMFIFSRNSYRPARLRRKRNWIEMLSDREKLIAAEIGVRGGSHAAFLIDELNISEIYLIDPYEDYPEYHTDWADDEVMSKTEMEAKDALESFSSTKFVKEHSNEALSAVPNDIDFVYIDGNHAHEYVKNDISNYYPILKEGGILAGHDYHDDWPGVVKAVDDFANDRELRLHTDRFSDWFFIKPYSN
jgi:predicted O-methyltransferase YrrM